LADDCDHATPGNDDDNDNGKGTIRLISEAVTRCMAASGSDASMAIEDNGNKEKPVVAEDTDNDDDEDGGRVDDDDDNGRLDDEDDDALIRDAYTCINCCI
jgi:hypothetical protein